MKGRIGSQASSWLLALLVALMEASWIVPGSGLVVLAVGGAFEPAFTSYVVAALWLLGYGVGRWTLSQPWPPRKVRLLLIGAALCSASIVLAPGLDAFWSDGLAGRLVGVQALMMLALWWRTITLARGQLHTEDIRGAFGLGVIAQTTTLFALVLDGVSADAINQGLTQVLVFVFAGLLSLALARVHEIARYYDDSSDEALPLISQWVAIVVLLIAAFLLVAALIAQGLTPDLVVAILAPPLWVLGQVLWGVLYVLALSIGILLEVAALLARAFSLQLAPDASMYVPPRSPAELESFAVDPSEVVGVPQWAVFALALVAMLFVLNRAIRRLAFPSRERGFREERDSVWSWRDALEQLRQIRWTGLVGAVQRRQRFSSGDGREDTIRELYRVFLRLGEELGHARHSCETPSEYAGQLGASEPKILRPAWQVTTLYERARYGEERLPAEDLRQAQQAVDELREFVAEQGRLTP